MFTQSNAHLLSEMRFTCISKPQTFTRSRMNIDIDNNYTNLLDNKNTSVHAKCQIKTNYLRWFSQSYIVDIIKILF